MGIIDRFEQFAAAFEECVADDDWSRLGDFLAADASYLNVGGPDPRVAGRPAILNYLKNDVDRVDRRFDSRRLEALTKPTATDGRLSRQWRCTYTLSGAPDLVVEGIARYEFDGDLIKSIEQELTPDSMKNYVRWMETNGHRLEA